MKGILFGGCSFTWGQGLYFYSDLNRLVYPKDEYSYFKKDITDAQIKFKDTIRFPRLVANHFKTFEVFKTLNGGCEDETFMFFENIFTDPLKKKLQSHLSLERYDYDDFDFIVIQLSQFQRNRFYFELHGEKLWSNNSPRDPHLGQKKLLEWMEVNNLDYDGWIQYILDQQFNRLLKELKFYEDKGIKTIILSWENTMIDMIKSNEYINKRFVKLKYENEEFDTIDDLQKKHPKMKIKYDHEFFGENPPKDHHPSKLCHRVIADNIINHIEKNYL